MEFKTVLITTFVFYGTYCHCYIGVLSKDRILKGMGVGVDESFK